MGWQVDCVNHSEIYIDHGKHTNMVESYFSRMWRMVQGQYHHVSSQYLCQYANHAAWLEDNRRTDNGTLAKIVVSNRQHLCRGSGRVVGNARRSPMGWHIMLRGLKHEHLDFVRHLG